MDVGYRAFSNVHLGSARRALRVPVLKQGAFVTMSESGHSILKSWKGQRW